MAYYSQWFDDRYPRVCIRDLPADCIADCSAQGDCSEAVDYWVDALAFDAPAWLAREYLSGYGAWDRTELCDHQENLRRLLFVWAGYCSEAIARGEDPSPLYLMK